WSWLLPLTFTHSASSAELALSRAVFSIFSPQMTMQPPAASMTRCVRFGAPFSLPACVAQKPGVRQTPGPLVVVVVVVLVVVVVVVAAVVEVVVDVVVVVATVVEVVEVVVVVVVVVVATVVEVVEVVVAVVVVVTHTMWRWSHVPLLSHPAVVQPSPSVSGQGVLFGFGVSTHRPVS